VTKVILSYFTLKQHVHKRRNVRILKRFITLKYLLQTFSIQSTHRFGEISKTARICEIEHCGGKIGYDPWKHGKLCDIVICSSSCFVQNHDVIKITDFSTNPSLCSIFNRKQFLRTIQTKSTLVTKKQRARALFREIFVDSMCTCHVSQIQKHTRTCVRALVFEC
jgi:hypothetical protein